MCDIIFPFLQELHKWSAQLQLVEVKRNAGCQLTEMADELAELGCASAEEPVFPGKLKYCSLLLHIQASMLTLIARVSRREHSQKDFKLGGPRCSGCCTVPDRHRTGPSGRRAIIQSAVTVPGSIIMMIRLTEALARAGRPSQEDFKMGGPSCCSSCTIRGCGHRTGPLGQRSNIQSVTVCGHCPGSL